MTGTLAHSVLRPTPPLSLALSHFPGHPVLSLGSSSVTMSAAATVGKRVERSASQDALLRSLQQPGKRQEVENKAQPHPAVQHLLPALPGESK